jgi:hypothetical protein
MDIQVFSNVPDANDRKYGFCGNQAALNFLLDKIKASVSEISEIHLALYLFNNENLYDEMAALSKKGIKITITSIPLFGYEEKKAVSAEKVYSRATNDGCLDLLIFPHVYQWYATRYVRGRSGLAYSLHIKAGLIKYKNSTCGMFLTSGNMAVHDGVHSETAIFIQDVLTAPSSEAFSQFFKELEGRSKSAKEYINETKSLDQEMNAVFDFSFVGGSGTGIVPSASPYIFFTAPFIKYGNIGSNHYAREMIVDLIDRATKRVYLCTQHLHDVSPYDGYSGKTLIQSLVEARQRGLDVQCIKQSESKSLTDKKRASFAECHLHYNHIPQKINSVIHDKFILIDDAAVVTTSNFTATNFGWGEAKEMVLGLPVEDFQKAKEVTNAAKSFYGITDETVTCSISPKGVAAVVKRVDNFSEVNGFIVTKNAEVIKSLENYFNQLWSHPNTKDVQISF